MKAATAVRPMVALLHSHRVIIPISTYGLELRLLLSYQPLIFASGLTRKYRLNENLQGWLGL